MKYLETINKYLPQLSEEIEKGPFISEPMVYKLAFKANNGVLKILQA